MTPYEEFLQKTIDGKTSRIATLKSKIASTNFVERRVLKRQLAKLETELRKAKTALQEYVEGLEWIREPNEVRVKKLAKLYEGEPEPQPEGS
jgi:septal ring factor EnvC (AmiA/AmiB activator)